MDNRISYTATSLDDIADHFDKIADRYNERLLASGRTTQQERHIIRAKMDAWKEAADTIRNTTIKPKEEDKS
jgi:hypothetical protein